MASDYSVEAFLAREQQELAGIDDEFGALTTNDSVPINGNNTMNGKKEEPGTDKDFEILQKPTVVVDNNDFENGLNGNGTLNGETHDQVEAQDDQAPIDGLATTLSALPLAQQNAMRRLATPTPPPTREEPDKIKNWRELQKARLEKKDLNEENEKKKLRDQAKRELDEWYKNRNEQLDKVNKRNRELEKELMLQRDSDKPGQEWERIAGLCDFNPKSARAAKDLTRFRSILLQMKNQPQKAGK